MSSFLLFKSTQAVDRILYFVIVVESLDKQRGALVETKGVTIT